MNKARISAGLFLLLLLLPILLYLASLHQQNASFMFMNNQQKCPEIPKGLKGQMKIEKIFPTMEELEEWHPEVGMGGWWKPEGCSAQQRVAILIPFRNRSEHLRGFLYHIHDFLQHQQADYRIFVINQAYPQGRPWDKFNRAKLFNAGFMEINKMNVHPPFDCFIFHDVDLVPENEHNLYRCNSAYPKRFIWGRDSSNYRRMQPWWFAATGGMTSKQFWNLNGFSNHYWGWGAEDNDMAERILKGPNYKHFEIVPEEYGKFGDLELAKKSSDATNPRYNEDCMMILLGTTLDRMSKDGLNTVAQTYKRVNVEVHKLYTNISLDLMYLESINSTDYPCYHLNK